MRRHAAIGVALALWACLAGAQSTEWSAQLAALETAATQGDAQAMTQLAQRYEHAEGVPRDYEKANRLYCKAARAGYIEAQFKLGWVYANGRGVTRDEMAAGALFTLAAKQGHDHASRLLQYLEAQPETKLPPCMLPDPPALEQLADGPARNRTEIEQLVHQLAPHYAVDPKLVLAVMSTESSFNPRAVSPKNAQGLMQLIPETAERFGVKQAFNPAENIKGGLAYLRWLLAFFQGDVSLVLAAYNAGERAVEKYRGIPPYAETRNYVKKITSVYRNSTHPFDSGVVEPSPLMENLRRAKK
ncbi:MAG TPA: transglycosylase SLT domain-containing protein [Burkholderiales bacterium]|nr:transglycosylase SLT domain-containing protein [Burkholderiales bacterium]